MTSHDLDKLPPALSLDEAARLLGASSEATAAAVRTGRLPVVPGTRETLIPTARLLTIIGRDSFLVDGDILDEYAA